MIISYFDENGNQVERQMTAEEEKAYWEEDAAELESMKAAGMSDEQISKFRKNTQQN